MAVVGVFFCNEKEKRMRISKEFGAEKKIQRSKIFGYVSETGHDEDHIRAYTQKQGTLDKKSRAAESV
jgi:hypothetical protein